MKKIIAHAFFLLTVIFLISMTGSLPQGPHDGVLKKAEGFYIEMKNNPDTSFFAYLLNKKLKTISNKGISGEVKFFFPDSTVLNAELKPAARNAFTAKPVSGFYGCKITFVVFGKSVSALFEKENQTAQKK